MNTIKSICSSSLRNEECYILLDSIVQQAKNLLDEDVKGLTDNLESTVQDYGEVLEASLIRIHESEASALNKERHAIFSSCRKIVDGSQNIPDEKQAQIWVQVQKRFDESISLRKANQGQTTRIIKNLIQSVRGIGDESLEAIGLKVWLNKLEEVNNKFIVADAIRFNEKSIRETAQTKTARAACLKALDQLNINVTYKASIGLKAYESFINNVNEAIDTKKGQVKSRKSRPRQGTKPGTTNETAEIKKENIAV